MVLETELTCDGGAVKITDFMPIGERCEVVRVVEGVEGEGPIEMLLTIRFGFGASAPLIDMTRDGTRFAAGPDAMILRGPLALRQEGGRVSSLPAGRKGARIPVEAPRFP